jgi:hypothetical protein
MGYAYTGGSMATPGQRGGGLRTPREGRAALKGLPFLFFLPWGWPVEGHGSFWNFLLKRSFPPRPYVPFPRKKGFARHPLPTRGKNKRSKWNFHPLKKGRKCNLRHVSFSTRSGPLAGRGWPSNPYPGDLQGVWENRVSGKKGKFYLFFLCAVARICDSI